MIDRGSVTPGFGAETPVSEAYLSHSLLGQIEAEFLPSAIAANEGGIDAMACLNAPALEHFQRL